MLGPRLTGKLITLGPIRPAHFPNYLEWFADPQVTAYLRTDFVPTLRHEEEWLERIAASKEDLAWAMFLGERHIGGAGLHRIDWQNRNAGSGTFIGDVSAWGKGYATDAMRLRTRYAFDNLGLEKITTGVWVENTASRRALERVGYKQAGLLRRHNFRHGRWHDVWLGEILRDEWEFAARD